MWSKETEFTLFAFGCTPQNLLVSKSIVFSEAAVQKIWYCCVAKNILKFSSTAFSQEPPGNYLFICKKLIKLNDFAMTNRRCLFKLVPIVTFCNINKIYIYRKNFVCFGRLFNPFRANPRKWSNTLKEFVGKSRRIVWECLIILWGWLLKG